MQTLATRSDRCSAGDLVRVLISAAKASHGSSAVEQLAASQALVQHLPSLLPHTLGKLLWALAKLDCRPPGLLAQLPAAMATAGRHAAPHLTSRMAGPLATRPRLTAAMPKALLQHELVRSK